MSKTWLYADPHLFHNGVCQFLRADGTKLRPWDNAEEMSEWMISEYNKLVSPEDRVYILGDVAMNRKALDRSLPRLGGRKILVKGNHDTDKLSYYAQHFDDIRAYVVKKGFIMSHIPIHPASLGKWKVNIHGHLHYQSVMDGGLEPWNPVDDRYVCVSVEHTEYRPILLDTVLTRAGLKP
jgi:calcineurin-like phosphoesterase family protein